MTMKLITLISCCMVVTSGGEDPTSLGDFADINTDFGLRMYKLMVQDSDNVFFSPYSITEALAMTYFGARGNTAEQMAEVCGFSEVKGKIEELMPKLREKIFHGDKNYTLKIANRLFGQVGYSFLPQFEVGLEQYYNAPLQRVDYAADSESSRVLINDWVFDNTDHKIKDLLPPGSLTGFTKLVLVNAIYFKALWARPFKNANTKNTTFHLNDNANIETETMHMMDVYRYGVIKDLGFRILELPYVGEDISMFVLLPDRVEGLAAVEKHITDDLNIVRLNEIIRHEMRNEKINVTLPKFKITHMLSVKDMLTRMGMKDAFSNEADFSGMDGTKMLKVTDVFHQAFVEVNEEGTEAAAATGIVMEATSVDTKQPPHFNVNRPFLFILREKETGSILFTGRVTNPSTTSMSRRSSYSWTSAATRCHGYTLTTVVMVTVLFFLLALL